MSHVLKRMLRDQRGATAIEYGLIVALIFLVIAGGVGSVARVTINMWGNVSSKVGNVSVT